MRLLRRPFFPRYALLLGLLGCNDTDPLPSQRAALPPAPTINSIKAEPGAEPSAAPAQAPAPIAVDLAKLETELVQVHGEAQRPRIARGLKQVAALWRMGTGAANAASDGDLAAFAREYFVADEAKLQTTLARFETSFEQLDGHLNEITREWRRPSDVDIGPMLPIDALLGSYDVSAHTVEDLFQNHLAFVALLNFPATSLAERLGAGEKYTRVEWAEARLTGRFSHRVPGAVQQRISDAASAGERYIASYNLWMHHILGQTDQRLFPKGLRLISHWNLRDQIRGDYGQPEATGLARQRTIAKVMARIVEQSIPRAVIDNPRLDWNPFTNSVKPAPAETVEENAPPAAAPPAALPTDLAAPEPDTRYALLLDLYRTQRAADPYSPSTPTLLARSFDLGREIPEERVVNMLREVCASPLAGRVAALIEKRLGRKLEPQDLWYAGFRAKSGHAEPELDKLVARRYPTAQAFESDMPRILVQLGFAADKAKFLASHIRVDPSRGAGHALQAMRRGDFPHLRTRIEAGGMNYKGYNIAVHELGHNVEQVFSLYGVDHTLLAGVPNNAFTEALAFVFQQRDLELLGLSQPDPQADSLRILNDFYATWEIAGVALVEIGTWHFMYDHPQATPAELRQAVVSLSKEIWNKYYAPVLGQRDALLLGIYSHMIQNTLYLPDYPLGHLIAFQIEEHLRKQPRGALGKEFERMATFGQVTPDLWLVHATGAPLGTAALLAATEAALVAVEKSKP